MKANYFNNKGMIGFHLLKYNKLSIVVKTDYNSPGMYSYLWLNSQRLLGVYR